VQHQRRSLKDELARKESTLHSFEKELAVQHNKVDALSKSLAQHRRLSSCNDLNSEVITNLKTAIKDANSQLEACQNDNATMALELDKVRKALSSSQLEHAHAEDRLSLASAKLTLTQSNDETSRVLREIQEIWAEVGLPMKDRQAVRDRLQTCVEDACLRMLEEASELRDQKREDVKILTFRLQSMLTLLGVNDSSTIIEGINSLQSTDDRLKTLNKHINEISHEYENAVTRCKSLLDASNALASELDLDKSSFSKNLILLAKNRESLQGNRTSFSGQVSEPILCTSFLDACEKDVKRLRLIKSEKMLSTVEMCNDVRSLSLEMDVDTKELCAMALYCIKRRTIPSFWNDKIWEQVKEVLSKQGSEQIAKDAFLKHMRLTVETLHSIAQGRRLLSNALNQVVEESHETILATADSIEVKELYRNLHDALIRLPPLSKQHVKGCLEEMKMFVAAADSVSQSEIETLTVSFLLH
jgi:regulator of replication initiation timing